MKMVGNLLKLYGNNLETIWKQYGNSWKSFTIIVVAAYSIQFTLTAYALGAFEHAADNA